MPALFFQQQLVITKHSVQPFNANTILLFDAQQLNVDEFDLNALLSPFELTVITRRKSYKAKQEYLATRLLLKYLVKQTMPQFRDLANNHISSEFDQQSSKLLLHITDSDTVLRSCLSHSNGFVGAALNVERIEFGFDIEKINLKRPFAKLAKHFYHLDEVNLITQDQQSAERFFRIWTLKEALAKATSQPIAKLLSPNVFTELERANLTALSCQYHEFDISVVSDKSTDWQCSVVNSTAQLRGVLNF
ncbi:MULTISPECIES: 4'-phosphopantetheinyl transferase superfamily protein [Pseudoalteromonas]|uniref:4'-phosphopantetheinyl transferase superfamily protein n=1 Tax=Pseudoalteromonas neustonica TaxID=1840331 RepID=A0ABY3F8N7_9GAMM|nr:4'-phosphopantetheinyl transferase superfamily protein [Pseudoalteromonas neustonica]TVU80164.1 4'-phosphopantetheinyl transferase superfamily protein [Pseudoalteromonas neustonica]